MALTKHELEQWLSYDPETGIFTWLVNRGKARSGKKAGSLNGRRYLAIRIDGKSYSAHRLAWLAFYGEWPIGEIDHINRIKTDNRIANLRVASSSQNEWNKNLQKNNKSGYRGVSWCTNELRWRAGIKINGRQIRIGTYDTPEEASVAYWKFAHANVPNSRLEKAP